MIGPVQFRLNQGTAKKWRAILVSTSCLFDFGQLSFIGPDGEMYASPEGLLASIACPNPTLAWDGVSHLYDGEQFTISDDMCKRLKLHGTFPDFVSFSHAVEALDEMADHYGLCIV